MNRWFCFPRSVGHGFSRAPRLKTTVLVAVLLNSVIPLIAQDENEPPLPEAPTATLTQDALLPKIAAAIQGVTTPDRDALARALHIGDRPAPDAPPNSLSTLGDLDGDGVPEELLKWAIPDVVAGTDVAPASGSEPLWAVYLLAWDGAHWKASTIMTAVEDFTPILINLGLPVGHAIGVIVRNADTGVAYPAVFQVKDHAAALLWDAQADDSRFEPLFQSEVKFQEQPRAPAELLVAGRANPGFLQVEPRGHRGFEVRMLYRWDGKGYIPAKTEFVAGPDYTTYRFIAALHLHDYKSAYALVAPAKLMATDAPTLQAFQKFIQNNWPEFLQDEVFKAPEPFENAPDDHSFALVKPDRQYAYHPSFSNDGKFLLTGLTRSQEASPAEK